MKKKLAWLLAVCMVLQLSSFTVFAEEVQNNTGPAAVETVTDSGSDHTGPEGKDGDIDSTDQEGTPQIEGGDVTLDGTEKKDNKEGTGSVSVEDAEGEERMSDHQQTGNLSVELTCNLPVSDIQTRLEGASAVLIQDGMEAASAGFAAPDAENGKAWAEFTGLSVGTYELRIAGGGFACLQPEY